MEAWKRRVMDVRGGFCSAIAENSLNTGRMVAGKSRAGGVRRVLRLSGFKT